MRKRIKGTLSLPKGARPQGARARGAKQAQPQEAQPQEAAPQEAQSPESDAPVPAPALPTPEASTEEGASEEATRGEAKRLLGRDEVAAFRERYGLEPQEFDVLYRAARGSAPQYGIDYAADISALKQRCAALKELIRSGDAPSLRARLLAQALETYGAMTASREAALKRKG